MTLSFLGLNRLVRTTKRNILCRARRFLKCPDAWGDIVDILRSDPDLVYVDIGAHHGVTAQIVHNACNNRIVAFEPTPRSYQFLQKKFQGCPRIELFQMALSDESGTAEIFINSNEQTNSLLDNDAGNRDSFGNQTSHHGKEKVRTVRFDDWASDRRESRWLLKLDVQGVELKVLQGAEKCLEQTRAVYAECPLAPMYKGQSSFWEIHDHLQRGGFVLKEIYPCLHDGRGRAVQTDALWIRPS